MVELVRSNVLLFGAHSVRSECVVHGGEVDIRLALLHVRLIAAALLRIELDLVLRLALALWLLWFLNHQLQVTLRELLVELCLRQFGVNVDFVYLVVERVVAKDTERLICLRHFSIVMQKDEKYCSVAFCDKLN